MHLGNNHANQLCYFELHGGDLRGVNLRFDYRVVNKVIYGHIISTPTPTSIPFFSLLLFSPGQTYVLCIPFNLLIIGIKLLGNV